MKRFFLVLVMSAAIIVADRFEPLKIGDDFHLALPLAGLACAVSVGKAPAYVLGFIGLQTVVRGSKAVLGDAPINMRPDGTGGGFPSNHTASATYGAVWMVRTCLATSLPASAVVLATTGYTGASRIITQRHDVVQVLAGGFLGLAMQMLSGWFWGRLMRFDWRRLRPGQKGRASEEARPQTVRKSS